MHGCIWYIICCYCNPKIVKLLQQTAAKLGANTKNCSEGCETCILNVSPPIEMIEPVGWFFMCFPTIQFRVGGYHLKSVKCSSCLKPFFPPIFLVHLATRTMTLAPTAPPHISAPRWVLSFWAPRTNPRCWMPGSTGMKDESEKQMAVQGEEKLKLVFFNHPEGFCCCCCCCWTHPTWFYKDLFAKNWYRRTCSTSWVRGLAGVHPIGIHFEIWRLERGPKTCHFRLPPFSVSNLSRFYSSHLLLF